MSNISLTIFHKERCLLLLASGEVGNLTFVQKHLEYFYEPHLSSGQVLAIKPHNLADFERSQQLTLRLYGGVVYSPSSTV